MPVIRLSPAQRADLRAQAHALKPVILIGGDGLTDPVVAETDRALHSHQLIKVRVFGDDREARIEIAESLCDRLNAALIQHIGKLLVIWRPESDKSKASAAARTPVARGTGPVARAAAAREAAEMPVTPRRGAKGAAPRLVKVIKPTGNERRRARPTEVLVRGNERVTAGGNVKRAKRRVASTKRAFQND